MFLAFHTTTSQFNLPFIVPPSKFLSSFSSVLLSDVTVFFDPVALSFIKDGTVSATVPVLFEDFDFFVPRWLHLRQRAACLER